MKLNKGTIKMKEMDIKEFRKNGLLFEINRTLLHPLGLALYVVVDKETGEEKLGGILDNRDDPEGYVYADVDFEEGSKQYYDFYCSREVQSKLENRYKRLGYFEQVDFDIEENYNSFDEETFRLESNYDLDYDWEDID